MERPERRLSAARKIVYSVVPVVVASVLVEVGFRLFAPRAEMPPARFVEPDPDLIWRLKPTSEGVYRTNGLGLRDTEFRADADVKVLLLGDSVSWADGLRDLRKGYAYLLERRLESLDPGRSYEVINTGVPGWSTFQQLRYLELHGLGFEPDLIALQFCLNDVVERYTAVAEYGGDAAFLGVDTRETVSGVYGWLLRNSRAFEAFGGLLRDIARDSEAYSVQRLAADDLPPELEAAWRLALEELDGVREIAEREGIPLLIVLAPYAFQLADPAATRQPQDTLLAWARRHDVATFDLLPPFAAEKRYPMFKDASHFSVEGHAYAAWLLGEPVRAALGEPK